MANFTPTDNAIWPLEERLDPDFEKNVSGVEFYTLPNGLRVLQSRDQQDRSFSVELRVNAGSIHQNTEKRGVPHFHEHMVFKGTEKFPNKTALYEFAENHNLEHNASTGYTSQEFYAVSDAEINEAKAACEFVSQVVFHPIFPEAEAVLEKEVVMSERLMYNNEPWDVISEKYSQHFYGEQHPLGGGGILGSEADIESFTVDDVRKLHEEFFHPENMLLVICSGLPSEQMRELAMEYFSVSKRNGNWVKNPIYKQSRLTTPGELLIEKDYDATYLYVSHYFDYEPMHFPNIETFALSVINYALGKRLYKDLRDQQGLAYSVSSFTDDIYHGRTLTLYGQFAAKKYESAKSQLLNYTQKLIEKPVTLEEYNRAILKRKSVRWADSARNILNWVADLYFYRGQFNSPEYMHKYYDQLTLDYVNSIAKKFLEHSKPEIIAVGPKP